MLSINGKKIGDVVEVTFVKGFFGVQAEERINDRIVLLDSRYCAHPGDRCRVRILGDNNIPNIYLVAIEAIIQRGDGVSSPFEKRVAIAILDAEIKQLERDGLQPRRRLTLARLKLQLGTLEEAREVIGVIEPVYNELRATEYLPDMARILSMAFSKLGHFDHAHYWSRMSETPVQENAPESALPPLFETYMRMSPELKRRVFNNASPRQ